MSTLDSDKDEKRTSEADSDPAKQPDLPLMQPGQSFQVREGDRIVIDKRKFRPIFTKYKKRTIITIKEK
jgi:hypothetical protein